MGSRLGAGLLTNLRAYRGNVRRVHMRANQRALPPPFCMSLTYPKCGGLAGRSPEWDFHALPIRQGACHNVKIDPWDAWGCRGALPGEVFPEGVVSQPLVRILT